MSIQVPVSSHVQVVLPVVRVAGGLDLPEEQGAVMRAGSRSCQISEEGYRSVFQRGSIPWTRRVFPKRETLAERRCCFGPALWPEARWFVGGRCSLHP